MFFDEHINSHAIRVVSQLDGSAPKKDGEYDFADILTSAEAQKVLDLVKLYGRPFMFRFFDARACPGMSSGSSPMLSNMLGVLPDNRFFGAIMTEDSSCPFSEMNREFGPYLLSGIHYTEGTIVEELHQKAQGVVLLTDDEGKGGSGVIVSEEGDLLTARHVLYNDAGEFRPLYVDIKGKKVLIKKEDVHWDDPKKDMAHLQVPALAHLPHVQIAENIPSDYDQIWLVGFPGNVTHGERVKTFTTGFIKSVGTGDITTTAMAAKGDSGGAMINSKGELVGIISSMMTTGRLNTVFGIPDESTAVRIPLSLRAKLLSSSF